MSAGAPPYDAFGPRDPTGPAIVLVHGTRVTRAAWAPQVACLRDEFRVVVPDLPGHGALADVPFTLDAAASAIEEVIEEACGGRAVLAGLSLGGYVAMSVAARNPERVDGLVLMGASREPVGVWRLPYRALALLFARSPGTVLDAGMRRFYRWRYHPDVAEAVIAGGFWSVGGIAALRALQGERFLPRLAAYPGPTLILNGAYDILFRLGERTFVDAAQRGFLRVVPRAAHLVNLDRPDAVCTAIRTFVRGPVARWETDRSG